MQPSSPNQWMEIRQVGAVTAVRFTVRALQDQWLIQAVGDELYRLAANAGQRLLVNFGDTQQISSPMIAKLIELQRRLSTNGGRLALCCPHPEIRDLFRLTHTDQILSLCGDEAEALRKLA